MKLTKNKLIVSQIQLKKLHFKMLNHGNNEICKNDINMLIDNFSMLYNDVMYIKKIINIYFENNVIHDEIKIFYENDDDIYMIAYFKGNKIVNYVIFDFDFYNYTINDFDYDTIEQCINEFFN